jgi:uncharacterized RDD family membrane protein YckC
MPFSTPQSALLRLAAFLIDTLGIALMLILPASILSYILAWIGGTTRAINVVWYVALAILLAGILVRDGFRGRSPGKALLGLAISTRSGRPCTVGQSIVRNLPVVIPLWNLVELALILAGRNRTGDRIAGTSVAEE